jgi:cytochrome P450
LTWATDNGPSGTTGKAGGVIMPPESSTAPESEALTYEPFDARYRLDPERHYERLRAHDPVYRSPAGYWVLTRYDDIQAVCRQPELYSNAIVGREALSQGQAGATMDLPEADGARVDLFDLVATPNMVSTDPPRHSDLRRIVNRAFLPKRLAAWDGYIAESVADLMSRVHDDAPWDVIAKLAMPLPVAVISRILSVEPDRVGDIKRWSDVIIETALGDERRTPQAQMRMLRMLREFSDYFVPLIEDRRSNPQEDMLSDLVRAEESETLSDLDTLTFIKSLMLAGNETTTGLIGNSVVLLLQHPEELAKVQADLTLVKNCIEESLRFRSPVQFAIRTPNEDVILHGKRIRKDEPMVMVVGSGNRDSRTFAEADRFNAARELSPQHLAFGHGIHTCLGFHLARREATAALGAIIPRLHNWRLVDDPPRRIESNFVYGYSEIRLAPR